MRMQNAKDERKEGKRICIELIEKIRETDGIAGVHVMVHKHERLLAEIIHDSNIRQNR